METSKKTHAVLTFSDDPNSKSVFNEKEQLNQELSVLTGNGPPKQPAIIELESAKKSPQKSLDEEPIIPLKNQPFFINLMRRISRGFKNPITSFHSKKSTKVNPSPAKKKFAMTIMNFFKLVTIVIQTIKTLRARTQFRGLDSVQDHQLDLINDVTYTKRAEAEKRMFSFINNKTLRRMMRSMQNFVRKKSPLFLKIKIILVNTMEYCANKIPVIRPNTKIKVIWDTLIICAISLYFFIIPMQLSFDFFYDDEFVIALQKINISGNISHMIILVPELMIVSDTCLKLITGFYEDGIMVTDKAKIVKHYLKKGLLYDLIAYVPVLSQTFLRPAITNLLGSGTPIKFLQLLLFCKFKRVHMAIANMEEIISSNGQHDYVLSIFRLLYILISITHLNACLWHAVAYFNPDHTMSTWISAAHMSSEYWDIKYAYSMYWAVSLMATIGFGERISPQNKFECLIGVAMLMNSFFLFGYCINSMRKIWDGMAKQEDDLKENIRIINGYMKRQNLNFELQSRVRKYLEYTINNESNEDQETEILSKLTKSLRKEVLLESYGKFIDKIPFFNDNFSTETKERIVFSLRSLTFSPEDYVYQENEIDDHSFFIVINGKLEEIIESHKGVARKIVRNIKKPGEIFGWESFMTQEKRVCSVVSKNFSTIFEIKRDEFMNIIRSNPEDYQKFCQMKDRLQMKNYDNRSESCLSCHRKNHTVANCPTLHFVPDRLFYIKRFVWTESQKRGPNPHMRKKRDIKSLKNLALVQMSAQKMASYEELSEESEESMEESLTKYTCLNDEDSKKRPSSKQPTMQPRGRRPSNLNFTLVSENRFKQGTYLMEENKEKEINKALQIFIT